MNKPVSTKGEVTRYVKVCFKVGQTVCYGFPVDYVLLQLIAMILSYSPSAITLLLAIFV